MAGPFEMFAVHRASDVFGLLTLLLALVAGIALVVLSVRALATHRGHAHAYAAPRWRARRSFRQT